jgi:pantothenate kinase
MAHVSLRVTEKEKSCMENYAKLMGINLSDAIKNVFFERLEDEYDLKVIREYEKQKEEEGMEYYTLEEVKKELGFD